MIPSGGVRCATWPWQRSTTPICGRYGSRFLACQFRSTKARNPARPVHWPAALADRNSRYAVWNWMRAATLPVTASRSGSWAMRPAWRFSKESSPTKQTITSRWADRSVTTCLPRRWNRKWRNRRSMSWWPREKRANPKLPVGSVMRSTESMTAWAQSSASSRASPAQRWATAASC